MPSNPEASSPLPAPPAAETPGGLPPFDILSYYPLLTAGTIQPPGFPVWKRPLLVFFIFLPAGLYPLFFFLQSINFLAAEVKEVLAIGISKEVPWVLSAVIITAAAAAILGRILGGKGPWGEAVAGGALSAAPIFGVLRGFGFSLAVSLGAAALTWLGLTATVVFPFLRENLLPNN